MEDNILEHAAGILGDTKNGLSGREIVRYFTSYSIEYDVKILHARYPFIKKVPNKRTAIFENLKCFGHQQQVSIIKELCEIPKFYKNEDVIKLRESIIKLISREQSSIFNKNIKKTENWLSDYPEIQKIYKEAIKKFNNNQYQRNILDDMRLCLELLIKNIVKNEKSLENNFGEIAKRLEKNTSSEFRNMLCILINYFSKYQNNHIKHNDDVRENEVEFIINITSSIMVFLIKNLKVE